VTKFSHKRLVFFIAYAITLLGTREGASFHIRLVRLKRGHHLSTEFCVTSNELRFEGLKETKHVVDNHNLAINVRTGPNQ